MKSYRRDTAEPRRRGKGARTAALGTEIARLQADVFRLDSEMEDLQAAKEALDVTKKELRRLLFDAWEREERGTLAAAALQDRLDAATREGRASRDSLDSACGELRDLRERLDAATREGRASRDSLDTACGELRDLRAEFAALSEENAALVATVELQRNLLADSADGARRTEADLKEVSRKLRELETVREERDELLTANRDLARRIGDERSRSHKRASDFGATAVRLERELAAAVGEREACRARATEAGDKVRDQEARIAELEREVRRLEGDLDGLRGGSVRGGPPAPRVVGFLGDSILKYLHDEFPGGKYKDWPVDVSFRSGAKVSDGHALLPALRPDVTVVFVHLGTNNLTNQAPSACLQQLRRLADYISDSRPGVRTVVSSVFKRGANRRLPAPDWEVVDPLNSRIDRYNEMTENFCRQRSDLDFVRHGYVTPSSAPKFLAQDGLHLNRNGVRAMGRTFKDYLDAHAC